MGNALLRLGNTGHGDKANTRCGVRWVSFTDGSGSGCGDWRRNFLLSGLGAHYAGTRADARS